MVERLDPHGLSNLLQSDFLQMRNFATICTKLYKVGRIND